MSEQRGHGACLTLVVAASPIGDVYVVDDASKSLLRDEMQELHLDAWARHYLLGQARTIAELAGADRVETAHLMEAPHSRCQGGHFYTTL